MAKDKTLYTCNACGATSPRWLGKCPGCGAWNSLEETVAEPTAAAGGKNRLGGAFAALAPSAGVRPLAEIEAVDVARTPTGQGELDRVLGGGSAVQEAATAASPTAAGSTTASARS